jgi:hypothetical protein
MKHLVEGVQLNADPLDVGSDTEKLVYSDTIAASTRLSGE